MTAVPTPGSSDLSDGQSEVLPFAERLRLELTSRLDPLRQATLGQYFTPAPVATLMAAMVEAPKSHVTLLDAGAGVGVLTAALIDRLCRRSHPPRRISVTAYEIDPRLAQTLQQTMQHCAAACAARGVIWEATIREADFIHEAVARLTRPLFEADPAVYNCVMLNPPYHKINTGSLHRRLLRQVGIETTNLCPSV